MLVQVFRMNLHDLLEKALGVAIELGPYEVIPTNFV